ncbi:MAG TPA: phenylalanine--tRNA ligase beta subunit-related protein [Spirochaetia bacterium]|nr:phenylalanine--tRNA ligase beta subunit-related protein [Spirochaetia bacterium]
MDFMIDGDFFAQLPEVCIGVVVAAGVTGGDPDNRALAFLREMEESTRQRLAGRRVKDEPALAPYREAFQRVGYNPNKFMPSVEALATRVAKGSSLPDINPLVNLINAVSLKYLLPMGAHDLEGVAGVALRSAVQGDVFRPFGSEETEFVPPGELVYAVGRGVRTRRWIWRQSELGKVTAETNQVFVPIDGFTTVNGGEVREARDELASLFAGWLGARVECFLLDRSTPAAFSPA